MKQLMLACCIVGLAPKLHADVFTYDCNLFHILTEDPLPDMTATIIIDTVGERSMLNGSQNVYTVVSERYFDVVVRDLLNFIEFYRVTSEGKITRIEMDMRFDVSQPIVRQGDCAIRRAQ